MQKNTFCLHNGNSFVKNFDKTRFVTLKISSSIFFKYQFLKAHNKTIFHYGVISSINAILSKGGKVKHEFWVASYEFKSTSYEFKSTSYEFKFTSFEFKSTSHEFKSMSWKSRSTSCKIKSTSWEIKHTS